MTTYNFKKIPVVPSASDFIDFTLSKTQRSTPTVVHRHYMISRIRRFYMRKVKFTQQNFHDRIYTVISQFPKLEDIHPFYSDLLNTLYNKDHYKLSLGQLNTALHLIDRVSSDYVKLLKYADSLYRCKQLKRAALGRMATIIKKQGAPLKYLEEVRQHMSRLPSIDPNARTLILCGCPNAGKSSFINLITRAEVEVQPYAFTTKSLYVGHTDYEFLRWQVIDTPGILDRPFDEMSTIELQAITALAHLRAAVIFFLDISEFCNVTVEQQMRIYDSIKPLFANKPLIVACNKTDVLTLDDLAEKAPESRQLVTALEKDGVPVLQMSTLTQEGTMQVKKEACDRLLAQRVDVKIRSRKAESILNRIHVAEPVPRDNRERKPFIPEKVLAARATAASGVENVRPKRKLEKDLEEELVEDYILDLNKTKDLANDEWKYDAIPTYLDGHNVADFIDPDIEKKLEALEMEEEEFIKAGVYNSKIDAFTEEEAELLRKGGIIADKRAVIRIHRQMNKSSTRRAPLPRTSRKSESERSVSKLRSQLGRLGVDMSDTREANFARTRSRSESRRPIKKARMSSRSLSRPPRDVAGVQNPVAMDKAKKAERRSKKVLAKGRKAGEADRRIVTRKPKHLYAGKRGIGKTSRR